MASIQSVYGISHSISGLVQNENSRERAYLLIGRGIIAGSRLYEQSQIQGLRSSSTHSRRRAEAAFIGQQLGRLARAVSSVNVMGNLNSRLSPFSEFYDWIQTYTEGHEERKQLKSILLPKLSTYLLKDDMSTCRDRLITLGQESHRRLHESAIAHLPLNMTISQLKSVRRIQPEVRQLDRDISQLEILARALEAERK